jgi:CheY-like chemotaxis protein
MDGYDATRRIRDYESEIQSGDLFWQIPIIAMTANVFKEDVDKCIEAGMNEHIGKPIDIDEVYRILRKYLVSK